ncbi:MAG: sulfite exporter TauE/SafE family protein [Woeseia sp.]
MTDYLLLAVAMLITGGLGGILAGLLGIGGGIVIVPVMEAALAYLGVDEAIRMHVAVATSLATIIPTSIASSRAHHRRQAVDIALVRRWAIFVLLGALAGTVIASRVHGDVLSLVFAVVAMIVALKMILPLEGRTIRSDVPKGILVPIIPTGIGAISSMMGIGGGTLSVATLTLFNQPIHRAVGTSALFGLAISLPGTVGFMLAGLDDPRVPPGSIGYVNLVGFALISPTTFLAAPLGAAIAHGLSRRNLSLLFGVFLVIVSVRMFYRAFAA